MELHRLPFSILAALGLACGDGDDGTEVTCLIPSFPETTSSETAGDADGDSATSTTGPGTTDSATAGDSSDEDTGIKLDVGEVSTGPCLGLPPPTDSSTGTDTGTGTGTGTGTTTASSRRELLLQLDAKGVLPPDVLDRLRRRNERGA